MPHNENWLQCFKTAGAVWEYPGHGPHASYEMATKHSGFYFNTDIVVSHPELVKDIGDYFHTICGEKNIRPAWVASYGANVASGLILSAKMSELLSARLGYVDLRRSLCCFDPEPDEAILIIIDDIHSGGSLDKMIGLIEEKGGKILPDILTLGNFSGHSAYKGREIISLFEHKIESWSPESCILCKEGSQTLPARQKWHEFIESNDR